MKVVLDVKQEEGEEVKVATLLVFSKDDDRDKIANKTRLLLRKLKKSLLTMPLKTLIMIWLLISQTTVQKRMRLLNFHSKILRRHL